MNGSMVLNTSLNTSNKNMVIETTSSKNLKNKRTSYVRVANPKSPMSAGPTGPLGIGTRLAASRRK
jgi:hypothetical protein